MNGNKSLSNHKLKSITAIHPTRISFIFEDSLKLRMRTHRLKKLKPGKPHFTLKRLLEHNNGKEGRKFGKRFTWFLK